MTTGLKTPIPIDCGTVWLLLIIGHSAHWQKCRCALLSFILFPVAISFSTTISLAGRNYGLLPTGDGEIRRERGEDCVEVDERKYRVVRMSIRGPKDVTDAQSDVF
jgi:hypothetical protein